MTDFELNLKGLNKIVKALQPKSLPKIKVGILGEGSARSGSVANNATIGAIHEFGTSSIPMRSFLRVPITENLNKRLESSGAFSKDSINTIVQEGSLFPLAQKIAITAEGIVLEAFDTGGFGKWPAWKNPDYENNTGKLLTDTQQLRNSITSEVVEQG